MLIDWFTVVAQGINFLVLVWLLKRYLYKPVLAAIDSREKHIALVIAEAESQKKAAQQERRAFEAKKAALDLEGAALLKQAESTAGAERAKLLADARTEANSLRAKQMVTLREEQARLRTHIAVLAQQEALAIARKVLTDLTGASLEERMTSTFLGHLHALDEPAKKILLAAFGDASGALVRSAFELTTAQRALIQKAVNQEFSTSITLRFEVAAEMLCGVEISAGGQRVSWSIAEYLDQLEQRIGPLSEVAATRDVAPIPATADTVLT